MMTTPATTPADGELLCCPFCGNEASIVRHDNAFYAQCVEPRCGIEGPFRKTAAGASAAWNRRATPSPAQATPADGVTDEQILTALESAGVKFQAVYRPHLKSDRVMTCGSIDARKIIAGVRAVLSLATPSPGKAEAEDAARYRWLRSDDIEVQPGQREICVYMERLPHTDEPDVLLTGRELDDAIDAAIQHASDCAVHNESAYPAGPCDCGAVHQERDKEARS